MSKKSAIIVLVVAVISLITVVYVNQENTLDLTQATLPKKKKKTPEERRLNIEARWKHEYDLRKNPISGIVPVSETELELANAMLAKQTAQNSRRLSRIYTSRGPSNLGGRTRAVVIDKSDNTSNTILAGGVSSGLFRTTDGGASWTKVSANDEIHNVTAIAQDPRPGFQNIWYYATGERLGNSASLGSFYFGNGVWKSTDGGLSWNQIPETSSVITSFDSQLDIISALEVSPINGDLLIASTASIHRFDGTTLTRELNDSGTNMTDLVVTSTGRVYAAFDGRNSQNGIWTSPTGNGSWTRLAENNTPTGFASAGRIVLGLAPSNDNILYVLYVNGNSGNIEADLWQYNAATDTWTDFSAKLPDEPNGNSTGNDPFAVQGGYDLVVEVNPFDQDFVVIGGTNVYKIEDINNDAEFIRIGGYRNNQGYSLYDAGGVQHHPDIHALVFDPNNQNVLFSGTDGGVHKTLDVTQNTVSWVNLNNDYQTYQYYHVALDPLDGSNIVLGGAQDNGTTIGGTDDGFSNNTLMGSVFGGDGVAVGIARVNADQDIQLYLGSQLGNFWTRDPDTGYRPIRPNGAGSQFVTYFYLDEDNNNALYFAGQNRLFLTTDAENITSSTWENAGTLPVSQNIRSMTATRGTYDPASSYLLIGGENGGVFKLDNPQNLRGELSTTALNITPTGASTSNGSIVSALAVHPSNKDIAIAVYANYGINNIFITADATSDTPNWTLVERNLSAHSVRSAAIAEVNGETIYFVGTARGLYSSSDPANEDWVIEGPNDIGLAVVSQLVYRPSDRKLLVGTHGNGMYETTVEATLSNEDLASNTVDVSVFPNPVDTELNLSIRNTNAQSDIQYVISDIQGKQWMRGRMSNQKIAVPSLQSGIYLLQLVVDGKKHTTKFIKR